MKFEQSFVIHRSLDQVWSALQDIPAMADCLPGATLLEDQGNGLYKGRIRSKLGPFSATFEGEAVVTRDEAGRSGHVEGKGIDKRGGSRSRLVLDYRLEPVEANTRVTVIANVSLSGPIAQFGRTGLVTEFGQYPHSRICRDPGEEAFRRDRAWFGGSESSRAERLLSAFRIVHRMDAALLLTWTGAWHDRPLRFFRF